MNLWTARVNYRGTDRVDISRSGCNRARDDGGEAPGEFLAPSAALVFPTLRAMKAAESTAERDAVWIAYKAAYRLEMLASWRERRPEWEALLRRERATIVCYCVDPERCHRVLAASYLVKLGAAYHGEACALGKL